jgi:hypothetical protein
MIMTMEQRLTFNDRVRRMVGALIPRIEAEVPETGDFGPVTECIDMTFVKDRRYCRKYAIKVYRMPPDVVPDPSRRYVDLEIYTPGSPYRIEEVLLSGTNREIIDSLSTQATIDRIEHNYARLLSLADG